jgi:hypothetical protein
VGVGLAVGNALGLGEGIAVGSLLLGAAVGTLEEGASVGVDDVGNSVPTDGAAEGSLEG